MIMLLASLLISLLTLLYCGIRLAKMKHPLYSSLILYAVACYTLHLIFAVIHSLCSGFILPVNIGQIGIFGCGAFLLSANFSQIDGIVDDRSAKNRTCRTVAVLAPLTLCAAALIMVPFLPEFQLKMYPFYIILMLPSFAASYFNLKHLFLPMDDFGFLKMTRWTNICALLLYPSLLLSYLASGLGSIVAESFFTVLNAILSGLLALSALKGAKRWKTSV